MIDPTAFRANVVVAVVVGVGVVIEELVLVVVVVVVVVVELGWNDSYRSVCHNSADWKLCVIVSYPCIESDSLFDTIIHGSVVLCSLS